MRKKAILACLRRAVITGTQFLALDVISMPRYLKEVHSFSCTLSTNTAPLHWHNITSVLAVLITRSFYLQNVAKTETSFYSYSTWGAISTISSAKASINKFKDATTYSLHLARVYVFYTIHASMNAYTRSKNKINNSGLAPSPCLTPLSAENVMDSEVVVAGDRMPWLAKYIFFTI